MAVKKSSKSGDATGTKAAPKRAAAKKAKGEAPAVASETAAKSATPKPAKKSAAPKASAAAPAKATGAKKAGEVKLNDRQRDFLKKIKDAAEPGYLVNQKIEQRTIEALANRKLLKKGPKHKESGGFHYVLTKAGEKHLSTGTPSTQS